MGGAARSQPRARRGGASLFCNVFLDFTDKNIVFIGGGQVALRKVKKMLQYEARIRVVSPSFAPGFQDLVKEYTGEAAKEQIGEQARNLAQDDRLILQEKAYEAEDLAGAHLVIAATNHPDLNDQIVQEASARGIWANNVTSRERTSVRFPAQIDQADGAIQVAIATDGKNPMVAKVMKEKIQAMMKALTPELMEYLNEQRQMVIQNYDQPQEASLKHEALEEQAKEALDAALEARLPGRVSLVGAGPGDPGLMTWEGLARLQLADIILYDYLAAEELLTWAKPGCRFQYVGKQVGAHSMGQEEIQTLLYEAAQTYPEVVRLKGGDPYVFGRGGEEVLFLKERGIRVEVIPGISSALAGLTAASIPITHRGLARSFHVFTGHTADDEPLDYSTIAKVEGTLVFLMGVGHGPHIFAGLLSAGKDPDTPVAMIERAYRPEQKVYITKLGQASECLIQKQLAAPALLVIGQVVDLRAQIEEISNTPMKRISNDPDQNKGDVQ